MFLSFLLFNIIFLPAKEAKEACIPLEWIKYGILLKTRNKALVSKVFTSIRNSKCISSEVKFQQKRKKLSFKKYNNQQQDASVYSVQCF